MPCDIVRVPWGSMATQSTRKPFSSKATARFSVVVVLATPPFWLANAMTLGLVGGLAMTAPYSPAGRWFLHARGGRRTGSLASPSDGVPLRRGARAAARGRADARRVGEARSRRGPRPHRRAPRGHPGGRPEQPGVRGRGRPPPARPPRARGARLPGGRRGARAPHRHSAQHELFVSLEGAGTLELHDRTGQVAE